MISKSETGSRLLALSQHIINIEDSIYSLDSLLDKKHGKPPTKVTINAFDGTLLLDNIKINIIDDEIGVAVDNVFKCQRLQLLKKLEELKYEAKKILEWERYHVK